MVLSGYRCTPVEKHIYMPKSTILQPQQNSPVRYTMKDGSYQYDELQTLPVTEWPYALNSGLFYHSEKIR